MASVIPKITSSPNEREVQLHLPIVENARKAYMPKVIPTYVVGMTYPLANLPKQRELHSELASLSGISKRLLGTSKGFLRTSEDYRRRCEE
jgi:hypothetical protein